MNECVFHSPRRRMGREEGHRQRSDRETPATSTKRGIHVADSISSNCHSLSNARSTVHHGGRRGSSLIIIHLAGKSAVAGLTTVDSSLPSSENINETGTSLSSQTGGASPSRKGGGQGGRLTSRKKHRVDYSILQDANFPTVENINRLESSLHSTL
jgi:hypothetical protein